MYKVMLLDDEAGVRRSIKAKIDWAAAGFEIAAEGASGKEGLQLLASAPLPDLVITDVRMPQLDGIGFIRACQSLYPGLRIVVLSGYSDFDYMKAAIQLGVKDYLLKPVVRGELTALLLKLGAEIREERRKQDELRQAAHASARQIELLQEQFLLQLVKDDWFSVAAVRERLQQLQLAAFGDETLRVQFAAVEMRVPAGRLQNDSARKDLLQLAFRMVCRETAELRGRRIRPFPDVTRPAMMMFLIELGDGAAGDEGERFLRLDAVAGLGEPVKGLGRWKLGYASCMLSWSRSTVHRTEAAGQAAETGDAFPPEAERRMTQAIESADFAALEAQLRKLFAPEADTPAFEFTFLALRIVLLFGTVANKFELGDDALRRLLWDCQTTVASGASREQAPELIHRLGRTIAEAVQATRASGGRRLAEAVRKYVDDNYAYELTLASLAEMFHINETYLSGLFKQSAGVTFSDYLTAARMKRAEELLGQADLKLTDIAMLVGYSTSSYFSTSFKKYYGKSPKEYREALLAAASR